ncbi:MAG: ABC transporter permease [Clostridiales bacterium]|nr:ABC transporter permease [Clostridiales bacterium]
MKLWYSFVKELQLSSKSWYFYIEIGMAVILLFILIFVVPKETDNKTDEYLYAGLLPSEYVDLIYRGILEEEDEDEKYERVEIKVGGDVFGADLFETDMQNIYFVDDREAVLRLAEEDKEIGVEIMVGKEGELVYKYYLQGYESTRLRNLYMMLHNNIVNYKLIDRHMDRQTVINIEDNPVILNNRENIVPVFLTYNGSLMGLFIIAAYVFLDKKEGLIQAYAVTASKVWQYLMSKVGVLIVTTMVTSLIIVIPVIGLKANYLLLILLVVITGFTFSSLGLVLTTYYKDMMQSFGAFYILIMIMIIPNVSYFTPGWEPGWLKWIPTYHLLESYKEVVSGGSDAGYVINVSAGFFVAGLLLFLFANYRFKKTLII